MDAEALKRDLREGAIDPETLVDMLVRLQGLLDKANQRIEELERRHGGGSTAKVDEPFSTRSEEQRQEARGRRKKTKSKNRKGRERTQEKIDRAERREPVYPEGVDPARCKLSHVRPVWRLESGRAVLIAYEVYRGPKKQYGKIPGVLGRSEFGIEFMVQAAYLVHTAGLSLDKTCMLLSFFQDLKLGKSQLNALLNQLAREWEEQFEALCRLLANSLVVHADETSWSIKSVWCLLSEKARILLYGVNKDAATLEKLLNPDTFRGLVISDNAAVYASFTKTQKCWAHLLRKAIKLTLEAPIEVAYRTLTDSLLDVYAEACRIQADGRLSAGGRTWRVKELETRLLLLLEPIWLSDLPKTTGHREDYRRLINELVNLATRGELFVFVETPPPDQPNGEAKPVSGTNNEAERTMRNPAAARDMGRANKTPSGARRQTILMSVLDSLRVHLESYTLKTVVNEVKRWLSIGRSCFEECLEKLNIKMPDKSDSVLDRVHPIPTG